MYSSVPTKEFDGVAGSETKLGGRYSLDLLRLDVECFMTWSISLARLLAYSFVFKYTTKSHGKQTYMIEAPISSLNLCHWHMKNYLFSTANIMQVENSKLTTKVWSIHAHSASTVWWNIIVDWWGINAQIKC